MAAPTIPPPMMTTSWPVAPTCSDLRLILGHHCRCTGLNAGSGVRACRSRCSMRPASAKLLPMAACIDAMVVAMRGTSDGSIRPMRTHRRAARRRRGVPRDAGRRAARIYGAKLVGLHPCNPAQGRPAIQGFVMLFDHASGAPLALLDGGEITALRTAAASGLATRELARRDAVTLGCSVAACRRSRTRGGARVREFARFASGGATRERTRICVTSRRGGVRDADRRSRRGRGGRRLRHRLRRDRGAGAGDPRRLAYAGCARQPGRRLHGDHA